MLRFWKKAVKYCMDNNVLKQFLGTHSSEVFNMVLTEWNLEEAKVAWHEEGREETQGKIARNALAKGLSLDIIHDITGLDIQAIQNIQAGL
jgi:predicted transposase YdaD